MHLAEVVGVLLRVHAEAGVRQLFALVKSDSSWTAPDDLTPASDFGSVRLSGR